MPKSSSFRRVVWWYEAVLAILSSQLVGGMARETVRFVNDMTATKRLGISER
jgi:hypothetical protein